MQYAEAEEGSHTKIHLAISDLFSSHEVSKTKDNKNQGQDVKARQKEIIRGCFAQHCLRCHLHNKRGKTSLVNCLW